jgi:hypothetical protein
MKTKDWFLVGFWLFAVLFASITWNNVINIFLGLDICRLLGDSEQGLHNAQFWIGVFAWSVAGYFSLVFRMLVMILEEDYVVFDYRYRL